MKYEFLGELEKLIDEVLRSKDRVLISVMGSGGTGKSYFGKHLRNNGCGKFKKRIITVIDDRVMWLDFLFFFRRRVKIVPGGIDELQPFFKKIPKRKKIIFYMNATPWERITEVDILFKLSTDESKRKQRLLQRYTNNPEKLKRVLNRSDIKDSKIKYTHLLEAKI